MKFKHLTNLLFSFLLFCTGCVPYSYYNDIYSRPLIQIQPLVGEIIDGRYYFRDHPFSLEVPKPGLPCAIIDSINTVAFVNQLNYFYKLEVFCHHPEVTFIVKEHPEIEEEVLNAMFEEGLLSVFHSKVPEIKVLSKEFLKQENGRPILFVTLYFPIGAILFDRRQWGDDWGKISAVHGMFLTLADHDYLLVLHMQSFTSVNRSADISDELKKQFYENRLLTDLQKELKTIQCH